MFDFLDIEKGKFMSTYAGLYYEQQPEFAINNDDGFESGAHFNYEYVDGKEKRYQMLFGNVDVSNDAASATIKSTTKLNWRIGAFVTLEDGQAYAIESVREDHEKVQKEIASLLAIPADIEWVVRLTARANPFARDNI